MTDKTTLLALLERAYEPYRDSVRVIAELSLVTIAEIATGRDDLAVDYSDQDHSGSLVTDGSADDYDDSLDDDLWGPLSNLDDSNKSVWEPFARFGEGGMILELDLAAIRESYRGWAPPGQPWTLLEVRDGTVETDASAGVEVVIVDWDNVADDRTYADDKLALLASCGLPREHVDRLKSTITEIWERE